jgi:hypothetical protein
VVVVVGVTVVTGWPGVVVGGALGFGPQSARAGMAFQHVVVGGGATVGGAVGGVWSWGQGVPMGSR